MKAGRTQGLEPVCCVTWARYQFISCRQQPALGQGPKLICETGHSPTCLGTSDTSPVKKTPLFNSTASTVGTGICKLNFTPIWIHRSYRELVPFTHIQLTSSCPTPARHLRISGELQDSINTPYSSWEINMMSVATSIAELGCG